MIALSSEIGKAIVNVRKAEIERDLAIQMYHTYKTEGYRKALEKAEKRVRNTREVLATVTIETYCHIPSTVLKDLK